MRQMNSQIRFSLAVAAALMALAPAAMAADAGAAPVSFKTDLQPILDSHCVFCHVTGAENGGLNLGRRVSYDSLMAASTQAPLARVTPNDAEKSYLIHKLRGTQLTVGGNGNPMPMSDPPRLLEPKQLDLFVRWIQSGAPKN